MSERSLGDAIKLFLKKSKLGHGVKSVQIEEIWEEIMGKTISKYTRKLEIVNGTLFITTDAGPLKNELVYQKAKIIERVNEAFGEVLITEVVIR